MGSNPNPRNILHHHFVFTYTKNDLVLLMKAERLLFYPRFSSSFLFIQLPSQKTNTLHFGGFYTVSLGNGKRTLMHGTRQEERLLLLDNYFKCLYMYMISYNIYIVWPAVVYQSHCSLIRVPSKRPINPIAPLTGRKGFSSRSQRY